MQGSHWKSSRPAGWVKDSSFLDRYDQGLSLDLSAWIVELVRQEQPQLGFGHDRREMEDERLIHHIPHYVAGSVKGPELLACNRFGVIVVRGKKVLKHLAQQFRVQGDFLFERCVFFDSELIAGKNLDCKRSTNAPVQGAMFVLKS